MARARNIKPGFFTNDELVELPFATRLLFIGLWSIADREGRLIDRPKKIKMEIFPADDVDCDKALAELASAGFIKRYVSGDYRVIEIVNFVKHQNPHTTEKDSLLPDEEGYFTVNKRSKNGCITGESTKTKDVSHETNCGPTLDNVDPPNHNALNPESRILIPDSLKPETPKAPNPEAAPAAVGCADVPSDRVVDRPVKVNRRKHHRTDEDVQAVFAYWQQVMGKERTKLDTNRARAIGGRLADGYTVADLCAAVDGCKRSAWHMGQNDEGALRNDIELICRNGSKVDSFLDRARAVGKPASSDKFQVASIDHSSSVAAMEENMRLRGIVVPVGDEVIEF